MSLITTHTPFTQVDASPLYSLGDLCYAPNGNIYRYVKYLDSVTYLAGHVCQWASATLNYVSNDYTGGSTIGTGLTTAAGICPGIPAAATPYGWLQVGGIALVFGDGSVAAGERVVPDGADGRADTMAAGEEHQVFGVALDADDTANDPLTTTALFHCRLYGLV
jgi:hypothetical protein